MSRHDELAGQGWIRQNTINEPRLGELVAEYRSLGFEVRLEPIDTAHCNQDGCAACFEAPGAAELFRTIYTRRGGNTPDGDPF